LAFVLHGVANDDRSSNDTIDQLQSEKESLLEEIVSRYEFGFAAGKPVLEELLAAKHDLLRAKLSVADSRADRIRLKELIVVNRGKLVEARIAANRLGNLADVEILTARVGYIDAKVDLLREQSMSEETK
jgi:hypothetical protein